MVNDDHPTRSRSNTHAPKTSPDTGISQTDVDNVSNVAAHRVRQRPKHPYHVSSIVLSSIVAAAIWMIWIFLLELHPACPEELMVHRPEQCVPEVIEFRHWSWFLGFVIILAFVIGIG